MSTQRPDPSPDEIRDRCAEIQSVDTTGRTASVQFLRVLPSEKAEIPHTKTRTLRLVLFAKKKRKPPMKDSEVGDAIRKEDVVEIVRALVERAKEGDVQAAKLLFDRMFGKQTVATKPALNGDARARQAKTLKIIERLSTEGGGE